jgi:hypothetical protein
MRALCHKMLGNLEKSEKDYRVVEGRIKKN